MKAQKYSVNQHFTETILSWVKAGEIAIPEIQRPFVWDSKKVRDLMDSLYHGFPIGYLIAWKNPNIKLKDGIIAEGKKILIDGQQRVAALKAAILGEPVISKEYKKINIRIAFNPATEKFEVLNTAIQIDPQWFPDISKIFSEEAKLLELVKEYCDRNQIEDINAIFLKVEQLKKIYVKQIGFIELDSDLDIETVTEIFIRINSKGVVLSQADFAMSKIAASERYNGSITRKCIDYFCHLAIAPEFYEHIVNNDKEFANTEYFQRMSWLKDENDDLYDPTYTDLLHVAFTSEFNRGELSSLVSLLSGRNFETKTYEEEIAKKSFEMLEKGILNFINKTNFERFVMIIKSAGFISPNLIRSKGVLNFAYTLYLKLKSQGYDSTQIESYVRRWFVLTILSKRYSGSSEQKFDFDIKNISAKNFGEYLESIEKAELSDAFWEVELMQSLDSAIASSPFFNVFLASQVKFNDKGFLSKDIPVAELIRHVGDIHHLFPKKYLKDNGLKRGMYNQVANFVYMQTEINVKIGSKPPIDYFRELKEQCSGGNLKYGGITDLHELEDNLKAHCIPESIYEMDITGYEEFLQQRRRLMVQKIKDYYFSL